ncbi:MAG: hypothetical protein WCQ49_02875 [Candidatus Saccharibacteria bacterium]
MNMNTSEKLVYSVGKEFQSAAFYEAVAAIDTNRSVLHIALNEIKDEESAALFLRGYADKIESMVDGDGNRIERGDITSLELALAEIKYMAGYHVSGVEFKQQLKDLLSPWDAAYNTLVSGL